MRYAIISAVLRGTLEVRAIAFTLNLSDTKLYCLQSEYNRSKTLSLNNVNLFKVDTYSAAMFNLNIWYFSSICLYLSHFMLCWNVWYLFVVYIS